MDGITTGELAEKADVNVQTVRYYERRGLLPEPPRTESGYRQYGLEDVRRLRFIRRAQELGFTLDEIAGLLDLRVDRREECDAVERQAREVVDRVEGQMADLRSIRDALTELIRKCREAEATEPCPILSAIDVTRTDGDRPQREER